MQVPFLYNLGEIPEKEGQKQGADVRSIYVRIRIVAAESPHAGYEVFIPLNREVVYMTIGRFYFFDFSDRQSHQITIKCFEAAINFGPVALQPIL